MRKELAPAGDGRIVPTFTDLMMLAVLANPPYSITACQTKAAATVVNLRTGAAYSQWSTRYQEYVVGVGRGEHSLDARQKQQPSDGGEQEHHLYITLAK